MEKWLRTKALTVLVELSNNTTNGVEALEEFAKYTGRKDSQDMLYYLFKNVADHVRYVTQNPDIEDDLNEIRFHI